MSAAPTFLPTSLAAEWERVDMLAACVCAQRGGQPIDLELKQRLRSAQACVMELRRTRPWEQLLDQSSLDSLDQDILACVVAAEAEPRIGWVYQELQPGVQSPYPTAALVRELLFLESREVAVFHARLASNAPLRRLGLLEPVAEVYQPLRPTARTRHLLLGWSSVTLPPGAVERTVHAGWNDIVLRPPCRQGIEELLAWVQQRERVEIEWGGRPSGGPVALFAGPSGTGKTFAAEVFAQVLGYRLLCVDLGMLVSKYIGETEKNINGLLDSADGQPIVLLFDEADSLFGRRGDIKDARDRYANMEVSHLLTRIEQHHGPCILTTNLRQHIDTAFLRRFHSVIEFPRPDAPSRAALWRLHLPPRAPRAAEVDVNLLAQTVLTGGQIRNVAARAAVLAAAASAPISLVHIARAIWTELAKDGRELQASMLGVLAAHLPREET